ncbi:hypothetical protein ANN_09389 [Periplaneta americana]|uniref:DDE-1 domain-containing protein n=1 Tax=Periplaneta americana TaxID=6978 RepID=A0ABQ8TM63_PERAM|nr:hypothetical protein ANN_09389 [Periplaneta americana]
MTSVVQPMDQGVIHNLKHMYRRQVVLQIINDDIRKRKIDLLDASRMLHKAWKQVTAQTIANCFRKAGFNNREVNTGTEIATEEPDEPISEQWQEIVPDVSYDTYVNFYDGVAVCGELTEEEIMQEVTRNHISSDENGGNDDENAVTEEPVPSPSEAFKMVEGVNDGRVLMFATDRNVELLAASDTIFSYALRCNPVGSLTDALVQARMPVLTSRQWQQYDAGIRPLRCDISVGGVERFGATSVLLSDFEEPSVLQFFSCVGFSSECISLMTESNTSMDNSRTAMVNSKETY